jgi:hypothetical protein
MLHYIALHSSAPARDAHLAVDEHLTAALQTLLNKLDHLHCTALHCTALHCTALHCDHLIEMQRNISLRDVQQLQTLVLDSEWPELQGSVSPRAL